MFLIGILLFVLGSLGSALVLFCVIVFALARKPFLMPGMVLAGLFICAAIGYMMLEWDMFLWVTGILGIAASLFALVLIGKIGA